MKVKRHSKRPLVMFLGLRGLADVQGGIETHVRELVRHLPIPIEALEVIGRRPYRSTAADSSASGLPRVRWLPALRHAALETLPHTLLGIAYAAIRRPALLHIHGIGPSIASPLARLLGLRVISTHHGEDYRREKWGFFAREVLRRGEIEAVLRTNACIAVSPTVARSLGERFGKIIDFIPNGVNDIPYAAAGEALARLGLTPKRYILNVARIVPEKRQLDLVEAFNKADLPGVKLVLCGGADHASSYREQVAARAAVNPSIVLTGQQSGMPLRELFWNAGLFVLPSMHEGLPIVLLEAMSCNLPVLVSDLPVYRAMNVPDNIQFPCGNIDALAERLRSAFLEGQPEAHDWSEFLTSYRWSDVARRTMGVYKRVLQANPGTGRDRAGQ